MSTQYIKVCVRVAARKDVTVQRVLKLLQGSENSLLTFQLWLDAGVTGGNLTAVSQPAVCQPAPALQSSSHYCGKYVTDTQHLHIYVYTVHIYNWIIIFWLCLCFSPSCGCKSEHPLGCCCGAQLVPPHICQSGGLPHPIKRPPLTEYQDSYSAKVRTEAAGPLLTSP